MVHDLPKLKQLDHEDITSDEKRSVGLDVSDDEEDEEEDDRQTANDDDGKFGK